MIAYAICLPGAVTVAPAVLRACALHSGDATGAGAHRVGRRLLPARGARGERVLLRPLARGRGVELLALAAGAPLLLPARPRRRPTQRAFPRHDARPEPEGGRPRPRPRPRDRLPPARRPPVRLRFH